MEFFQITSKIINERSKLIHLFLTLITGAVLLIFLRSFIPVDKTFIFLTWNLFLAFIPLIVSSYMKEYKQSKTILFILFLFWLVFFPNAPYVLTDFIHLSYGSKRYLWLDILTISWFAMTSVLAAIFSLNDVVKVLSYRFNIIQVNFAVLFISFLTGFGIYLGRYLRFNSWDVVTEPGIIVSQIFHRFAYPHMHLRTWTVTLGFGLLMYFTYKIVELMSTELKKAN